MTTIVPFDFDGLDETALVLDPEHGPCLHSEKFIRWLGWKNPSEVRRDNLQAGDEVDISSWTKSGRGYTQRNVKHLTKRGVRRLALRSDHPRAIEYADKVLDMLDTIDRDGGYISAQATADQRDYLQLKIDYLEVTNLVKGAIDYQTTGRTTKIYFGKMQNAFHYAVTGMTASQLIDSGRPQITPTPKGKKVRGRYFLVPEEKRAEGYLGRIVVGELGLKLLQQREYTVAEFVSLVEGVLREQYQKKTVPFLVPGSFFC